MFKDLWHKSTTEEHIVSSDATCVIAILRNHKKCKYIFIVHK